MKHKKRFLSYIWFYFLVFACLIGGTVAANRAVTALSEAAPLENRHCIVIDAGHGGVDGGAISCTGISESVINLQVALRLNDLLNLMGYDTFMIRTTDISVYTQGETIAVKKVSDLKQRVKLVNETANALLVSIHQNHFSDSRYSGAQVFSGNDGSSRELADFLQNAFVQTVNKGSNRKPKKADGIYLMEHITCPGVLIECGFLSHAEEEAKLRSPAYQKALCCVIASTISNFLDR